MTARLRLSEIFEYGTHSCRQRRRSLWVAMRQASERWNAVDCGSIVAASAMRARKDTSSASPATMTSNNQRETAFIGASCECGAQLGQHLGRRGPHAAPDQERLGGLLHEHAEAI